MGQLVAGVIGAGILGGQHARYLHGRTDVRVAAIADLRREAADKLAAEVGAQGYGSYEEMLRANKLDLVVVATPDALHRGPTVAALEAGVPNILQEKPLATNMADADVIYNLVEQKGARLFVHYANRASPLDIASCYVIRQGLLGRMVYGESRLDDNISVPTKLWGNRTSDWVGGSSTAHFLLSHIVDLMRWYFHPAEVREVYAISQNEVLRNTPDVYDAYLTFDSGLKLRVKADWIKHIDELVEYYSCFSGAEGTLVYNKLSGFNTAPGWRANLSTRLSAQDLLNERAALAERGVDLRALVHQPSLAVRSSSTGPQQMLSLEYQGPNYGDSMALAGCFIDGILANTWTPSTWKGPGPLPTHVDGLKQTQIVTAIVESAATGRIITLG